MNAGGRRVGPPPRTLPVRCASVLDTPVDADQAEVVAQVLAALADPVRLRLFSVIAARGTTCSCDLVGPVGRSQPTVSHHTKILAGAGLITGHRVGREVWWSIVPDQLAALRGALGGEPA